MKAPRVDPRAAIAAVDDFCAAPSPTEYPLSAIEENFIARE
jgi:hypothetical protein